MNDVEANLQRIIATNCSWNGFSGICGPHCSAYDTDSFGTLHHGYHNRARGDMFYQARIKWLAFMNTIVLFGQFWRYLNEFHSSKK
jgi:hypothetical protein